MSKRTSTQAPTLSDFDCQDQAQRFLGWFSRISRGTPIKPAFKEWARSKDFSPEDTASIWRAVEEEVAGHQDLEEITIRERSL